jgi:hypothetical protein
VCCRTSRPQPRRQRPDGNAVRGGLIFNFVLWQKPVLGALSGKARRAAGLSPAQSRRAYAARKLALPAIWLMQRRPVERYVTRVMWGPDAAELIASARKLHRQALAERDAGGSDV